MSQLKLNKTTVCALPSIHLPLTREARMWCGARDYCPFAMGVRVTVFGATGGARKTSDKCSFAKVVEMERVDATGGASKARMP